MRSKKKSLSPRVPYFYSQKPYILTLKACTDNMRRFLGADIDRIANGAPSSLITSRTITELLTSSGTSGGQPKLLLSTEELDLPLEPPHPRHEQVRAPA